VPYLPNDRIFERKHVQTPTAFAQSRVRGHKKERFATAEHCASGKNATAEMNMQQATEFFTQKLGNFQRQ